LIYNGQKALCRYKGLIGDEQERFCHGKYMFGHGKEAPGDGKILLYYG
jgi:hypothetical protein